MMITRDDPRWPERPGFPLPPISGSPAGDTTVWVQLKCQRGRWRLSQLGPALRLRLVCAKDMRTQRWILPLILEGSTSGG